MKLTVNEIRSAKATDKDLLLNDGDGLYLRVSHTSGRKTWISRLHHQGKQEKKTIGAWPEMTLAAAREETRRLRHQLQSTGSLKDQPAAMTVGRLADQYIDASQATMAQSTYKESVRMMHRHIVPVFGDAMPEDVKRRDAIALIESLIETPGTARQVQKLARAFWNWMIEREEHCEANPFQNLTKALPQIRDTSRERSLSEEEIRRVWHTLTAPDFRADGATSRRVLLMILVTAQRPGEVCGMRHDEIKDSWWTIPAEKAKNRKEHKVYLTPLAKTLIFPPHPLDPEGPVFASPRRTWLRKPILRKTIGGYLQRYSRLGDMAFTPHDLRRTAATHLARLGCPDEVIDAILNHTKQGVISVYNRHKYDAEKKEWLTRWGEELQRICGLN